MTDEPEEPEWVNDAPPAGDAPPAQIQALERSYGEIARPRDLGAETASSAMAAARKAEIQARCWMAMERPRQPEIVRRRVMEACERPDFAERAVYSVPRGRKYVDPQTGKEIPKDQKGGKWVPNMVEGPSVALARHVRQSMGNMSTEVTPIYEDAHNRIVTVTTVDYESNTSLSGSVTVAKTVERSKVFAGTIVLATRLNSDQKPVYIVAATDAELNEKQNALTARIERNQIMALAPTDLRAAAVAKCKQVSTSEIRREIDGQRKGAAAWFTRAGATDAELTEVIGRPITEATAEDLMMLRGIKEGITEGSASWKQVVAERRQDRQDAEAAAAAAEAEQAARTATTGADAAAAVAAAAKRSRP